MVATGNSMYDVVLIVINYYFSLNGIIEIVIFVYLGLATKKLYTP